jgi:glycerophosphoryl diester phosphodiesterase
MKPLNIAHRGGAALRPENSLSAFRHAIALGANGAELDVQLTADGVAVIYHDFHLNRDYTRPADGHWPGGATLRIKDLVLEDVRGLDIGTVRPGSDYAAAHPLQVGQPGECIPTLADVVALAKNVPGFRLLVELKCDFSRDSPAPNPLADAALALVEEAGFLDRTIFVGFQWGALARVKARQPDAEIWCTSDENIEGNGALFDAIKRLGAEGWFPYFARLTPETARLARAYGLKLAAWTVNDEPNMRRLLALGVDAICTDRPDLLQALE